LHSEVKIAQGPNSQKQGVGLSREVLIEEYAPKRMQFSLGKQLSL